MTCLAKELYMCGSHPNLSSCKESWEKIREKQASNIITNKYTFLIMKQGYFKINNLTFLFN